MKVAILCGGQGTRIRAANEELPKPMLPVGNRPILWHIMNRYAQYGLEDFVLCLGYKGWMIKEYFLRYRAMVLDVTVKLGQEESAVTFHEPDAATEDWSVTLAETGEASMTGYRVKAIRKYVENDDFFCLTYGDGLSNIDIGALLEHHKREGRIATVTAVRPPGRFGEMELDGDQVRSFSEKPQTTGGLINGGFMVFDAKRIWDYLPGDESMILEQDPLRNLTADGELSAFVHEGFWMPMDTFREYKILNDMWKSGGAPWTQ